MIHPSWHEPRKYYGAKYRLYHEEHPKAILFYSVAVFIGFGNYSGLSHGEQQNHLADKSFSQTWERDARRAG
ncbi:MAG: hypothetical protein NT023_12650 [Armatimonadetes bacterium]|nr:hypothetical protein [Armatimonadota bacterium]